MNEEFLNLSEEILETRRNKEFKKLKRIKRIKRSFKKFEKRKKFWNRYLSSLKRYSSRSKSWKKYNSYYEEVLDNFSNFKINKLKRSSNPFRSRANELGDPFLFDEMFWNQKYPYHDAKSNLLEKILDKEAKEYLKNEF